MKKKNVDPWLIAEYISDSDVDKLVPGYNPWIGDVSIDSKGAPFPIPKYKEKRSRNEIKQLKEEIREQVDDSDAYNPPIRLSDYCLVAKEIWKENESSYSDDENCQCCLVV